MCFFMVYNEKHRAYIQYQLLLRYDLDKVSVNGYGTYTTIKRFREYQY